MYPPDVNHALHCEPNLGILNETYEVVTRDKRSSVTCY